jgi:hypothetical protein
MKVKASIPAQEPVGIVISGFPREPEPSVFSAYVWGPAPVNTEGTEPKAA